MTSLVVTYLCVRILAAFPCEDCFPGCHEKPGAICWQCPEGCSDKPIVQHELRSRTEDYQYCKGFERPPYTDGDWTCSPLHEVVVP